MTEELIRARITSKAFLDGLNDLLDITTRMLTAYDLKSLLQHILQVSIEVSGGSTGSLMLLDEKTGTLTIEVAVGLSEDFIKNKKIKLGEDIAGWVAKNAESVLLKGDLSDDPRFSKFSKKGGISSAMSVPLKIENKAIGVLNINSRDSKFQFTEDDMRFIAILTNQASISIRHMRLYEDVRLAHQESVLARNRLIASEKLASLGQLAAGVAHEINNPLAVISANAQYMASKIPPGDPRMSEVNEIKSAHDRCAKIVDRLLKYSRHRPKNSSPVDVNSALKEVLELSGYQISLKKIRITEMFEGNLKMPRVDADELKEVFLNMVLNASDAMPQGGALTIMTKNTDNGKAVMIEFRDTGCGIPKENIDKIFDPFFTTKQPKGTGLGLSICQRIISEYKGSIKVESSPGKGATLIIILPI